MNLKKSATWIAVIREHSKDGASIGQGSSFSILDISNESLKSKKTKKRKLTVRIMLAHLAHSLLSVERSYYFIFISGINILCLLYREKN